MPAPTQHPNTRRLEPRGRRPLRARALLAGGCVAGLLLAAAGGASAQVLVKSASGIDAGGAVDSGASFFYRLDYHCDSPAPCLNAEIVDLLPLGVEHLGTLPATPAGDIATLSVTPNHAGTGRTQVRFTLVSPLAAGSRGTVQIQARFSNGITPATLTWSAPCTSPLAPGQSSSVVDNLNARIKAWWWMIGEFVSVTHTRLGDHRALLWCFYCFLPLQYWLIAIDWYGLFSILIPVYAFLLLPISAALGADTTRFLERAAKVQWGLMICVYCISHVPALLTLDIPGFEARNLQLIVFLVLTVQSSDVFQYVWGKLFGKRKLAPEISPSKTLEGHGGMLDRVDSISFFAPIFFQIVRYWWVP